MALVVGHDWSRTMPPTHPALGHIHGIWSLMVPSGLAILSRWYVWRWRFFFADGMWSTTKGSNYPAAKIETSKPFHSHTKSRRLQGSVWRLDERLSIKEAVERTDSWIHFPKISYVMIHDGEFMFPKHDVAIGCFRSAVHRTLQSVWSLPLNCAELGEKPLARCI